MNINSVVYFRMCLVCFKNAFIETFFFNYHYYVNYNCNIMSARALQILIQDMESTEHSRFHILLIIDVWNTRNQLNLTLILLEAKVTSLCHISAVGPGSILLTG